ncbi:gluconate 2-dehydrogenase subunit 3 family protein [Halogeometricum borinquense]|uniref:Gluconate 2-dehydrogenase subunit 3 family protein n=1 Tax=Halogeometricum borinquense TaxID=60847 RepID=A0A6C0UFA0_9EURY|nr:gluconate 2-dehydrogenase subunit 3 family protein [Halogeometricum borinquense]QIB73887.1 gluconate 2-dehydrogenase subunit 3 family protein [Halogeometricum borinquense]QIQ76749.1 gluconate 2-dehydrogenase subunit 3 family protein [Halogeometricum borinquense]
MKLTRRDAVAALAAVGAVGAGAVGMQYGPPRADDGRDDDSESGGLESDDESPVSDDLLDVMDAAAAVIYPSDVEAHRTFVERYVLGRTAGREAYRRGLTETAAELDAIARDWRDSPFAALPRDERDEILRGLGVETADPEPDGTISERLRFYVVNDLLFAFYSSPTGGRLVGIENPIGHPGGTGSYRRATMPENESEEDESDG